MIGLETMGFVILKWFVLPLLVILVATAVLSRKTYHVELFIPAPPEVIWTVLMDTESYSGWNPVFVSVDGHYAEGTTVTNAVQFPDGSLVDMKATVRTLTENREIRQYGGMPGIITFDHRWLLEPVEGGTLVSQHEVDRGLWVWFWDSQWIEPAYQKTLEALAVQTEKTALD